MVNILSTFTLLIWKHWTLAKRSPCQTVLFELVVPLSICLVFVTIFRLKSEEIKQHWFEPFYIDLTNILCSNTSIAVAPKSKIVNQVVDRILRDCPKISFTHYENSQQLNEAILLKNFYAAIQFDDSLKKINKNTDLPSDLKVTIRIKSDDGNKKREWLTELLYPLIASPGPRNTNDTDGEPGKLKFILTHNFLQWNFINLLLPRYQNRGFLLLQQLITMAFVNNNQSKEPRIMMFKYPYPPSTTDMPYNYFHAVLLPFGISLIFGITYVQLLTAIVTEKEQQLKESMKVMGLPLWLNWLTWFIRGFIILFIVISVLALISTINIIGTLIFPKTDGTLLFVFLILYACSIITSTFLTSVFFSNANVAVVIGSIAFFLGETLYLIIKANYFNTSLGVKLGVSVLSNSAMCFGVLLIIRFESFGEGAQWSNLLEHVSPEDNLTLGYIMLMVIFDTFLYLIIALYVDAIFPGEFGVPKPWYFPVLFLFSCCGRIRLNHKANEPTSDNEGECFEKFTGNLPKGIQLKNLSKSFGKKSVVKNLNLDIYEGHITVLLGQNGAGKTTTMSMISGMCPPTRGIVIVNGFDLRKNTNRARDSMGLCFQHNVLFDNLTIEENLYFFSKLKGLEEEQLTAEITHYLNSVLLTSKKNELVKKLSGGMKRKLSVAIALCGNPKVVLLDEPTSGMDPLAREIIRSLIKTQKRGRTILLTTHSMEEADLLGDRIAIMTVGELQCCGSSFFLKKKLAAGYHLIMEVSPKCVPQSVTSLLHLYIPQVKLYSHVGSELTYQLPESESSKFEKMLHELEFKSEKLGILSYGISYATIDQVFMKVGVVQENEQDVAEAEDWSSINHLTGCPLMANQFFAMLLKKLLATFRNWILFVCQIILTVCMLLFFLMQPTFLQAASRDNFPALKITLDSYPNSVTLITGDKKNSLFVNYKKVLAGHGKLSEVTDVGETILKEIKSNPGVVNVRYIVGASFKKDVIIAWFNGDPYHSAPLALSLVLNSIYKHHLGKKKSITFINHPLPLDLKLQLEQFDNRGFMLFMALGYSISLVVCFFLIFYIKERVSKSRHLQYTSGTNVFVFWMAAFLADLIIYILSLIPIIITIAVLKIEGFRTFEEISRLTVVFITFGFFVLPFMYLTSNCISIPTNGFVIMLLIAIISGIGGVLVVYLLQVTQSSDIARLTLHWIFIFTPFYTFCKSILDLNLIYTTVASCSENASPEKSCKILHKTVCCDIKDYFSMTSPGIGSNILTSLIMFLLLFTILIAKELRFFASIARKHFHKKEPPKLVMNLDNDVEKEIIKIKGTPESILNKHHCLVLHDVTKYYEKDPAVNGLCLAVKPYECFGLLGVNGAGKTTTFKMLTGDLEFSYGSAWLKGWNIETELKNVQKLMGFCPQFDALLDDLTVRDTLKMFALIRGIPRGKCKEVAEELARDLDFFKHIDKRVKHLSSGTKRKLSTAVAVIGEPLVIFLDEPTTGVDPAGKRRVWKYLCRLRDNGKCIILTSHSMEECEALCTRIAIMVNGNFQCLGSVQHLKNKFIQGYFLTVKIKKIVNVPLYEISSVIESFIKQHFPNAKVMEKYQELLAFQLPVITMPWSQIFGLFERHKKELKIEDYSVGQSSLNQVFLSFTQYQIQECNKIPDRKNWWEVDFCEYFCMKLSDWLYKM